MGLLVVIKALLFVSIRRDKHPVDIVYPARTLTCTAKNVVFELLACASGWENGRLERKGVRIRVTRKLFSSGYRSFDSA